MDRKWLGSILADFDGTACAVDVANALCEGFAADGWQALDDAVRRGDLTLRAAIDGQAAMLQASREEMLRFALERFAVDPTFVRLVSWAEAQDVKVTVVSDGFGFYIEAMLAAAGLSRVPVLANRLVEEHGALRLEHPFEHPLCVACGTCKMRAVHRARATEGAVAFVGEGESDRFGALFADAVFAKDRLATLCDGNSVPYFPWADFDDIRVTLTALQESPAAVLGRAHPARCPGWTPAPARDVPAFPPVSAPSAATSTRTPATGGSFAAAPVPGPVPQAGEGSDTQQDGTCRVRGGMP